MNGMAMHGGVLPVGGTFFVLQRTNIAEVAVRLAALSESKALVYSWTHDSVWSAVDGPTHPPTIEHIAADAGTMPVRVIRPATMPTRRPTPGGVAVN
jgi:transketolase